MANKTKNTIEKPLSGVQSKTRNEQKKRRYQVERTKKRRKSFILWGSISAVIIIIVVIAVIYNTTQNTATTDTIAGVVHYSNLTRKHVTTKVNYPQTPPVGGNHNPVWLNCGIYDAPVTNENAVHSLEHGAVWITYQPGLSSDDVVTLRNLVSGHSYAILSPYPDLPSPVVASAWGYQLKVTKATDPRLAAFLKKYEQGPQTQEPGAACSGGTGTPIQQ
jgi:uncharacterized membrane protein YvbJ